ncbi:MAG: hypothetical protein ACUVWA_13270 [Candidatus Oleimicrobiaceae bacterium]
MRNNGDTFSDVEKAACQKEGISKNRGAVMMKISYFLLVSVFYLIPQDLCLCQWSTDPSENNVLAWWLYVPVIISGMKNAVIVAGQTHWIAPKIYAQRMSVDGRRLWPGYSGVRISDSPDRQWIVDWGYREPQFGMSDGAGGCYIGYQIAR